LIIKILAHSSSTPTKGPSLHLEEESSRQICPTFFNGKVFVFGGYDENNSQVDSCEKFNLARNLRIDLARLPEKIGYSTNITVDKEIFVTRKFSSKVLSYNP
jgi:hypothetical protein